MEDNSFSYGVRTRCRLCDHPLEILWEMGNLALTGHFPLPSESVPEAPLTVAQCSNCSLVQLAHDYSMPTFFGPGYGYRSGLNASMVSHLTELALSVEKIADLQPGDLVVDIGGNDGTTLNAYSKEVRKVLIDPTARNWSAHIPADVFVIPDFFKGADQLGGEKAKLITTISMLYDLPDPMGFIQSIHASLQDGGYWLCEQSDLELMLEANSFDTICHEHLEYYSREVLFHIASEVGLLCVSESMNAANGGSRRLLFQKRAKGQKQCSRGPGQAIAWQRDSFERLRANVIKFRGLIREALTKSRYHGLGASTKGNTLLQVFNIDVSLLPFIAEINPDKYGKTTPGTNIPIISEEQSRDLCPDGLLVLPWHFKEHLLRKADQDHAPKFLFPLPYPHWI